MKKSSKNFLAIGLMSGTSMDGIDLALIESDGKEFIRHLGHDYQAFLPNFRQKISNLVSQSNSSLIEIKRLENEITKLHANLVNSFLAKQLISSSEIDFIGFHGQTIIHAPNEKITWQLGNASLLAHETKISVIADFRTRDVICGGQGAPLVPVYHRALFAPHLVDMALSEKNAQGMAILNIGGISNLTYFDQNPNSLCAFDCAFGNAPLDDLMQEKFGKNFDENGEIAAQGKPDLGLVEQVLSHAIYHQKPPKSYHRNDFVESLVPFSVLLPADHLASLGLLFAKIVKLNLEFLLPLKPRALMVCGGGRKNQTLLSFLRSQLSEIEVKTTDEIGLNGDIIEAEAFAYLAILRFLGLPSSFFGTTAVKSSDGTCVGGVIYPFKFN